MCVECLLAPQTFNDLQNFFQVQDFSVLIMFGFIIIIRSIALANPSLQSIRSLTKQRKASTISRCTLKILLHW